MTDPTPQRELLAIPMLSQSTDIYSGVARASGTLWATRRRVPERPADTVVVFCHPSSNFMGHYALAAMAAHGIDAVGLTTRYIGNDSAMLLENAVVDVGACVQHLRDIGYERVVLVGNSGGGELAALYQAQAEKPSLTSAPCGAGPDLTAMSLSPADALVLLNAHIGRARILTESLDPAVLDEHDPFRRDPDLDLFAEGRTTPLDPEFVAAYRAGQEARNHAITAWVEEQLAAITARGKVHDLPFVVHATCADPRMIDLSIEPTDREPGCLWGDVEAANFSPATLAHHTSLRAWLSQWSLARSNGDGRRWLPQVSVPIQVLYGTADQGCFPSHAEALYAAIAHDRTELVALPGATHYFRNQPTEIEHMCRVVSGWVSGLA